ncbi:MAG: hypothetical protein LBC72_03580, partial [Spirochaetaceae bacterium]|nr:hypothetical protein [Spirochaetaceae bacterium]
MADKLDWLGKHLVLIRYTALGDVVEKEGYKIRPDLAPLAAGVSGGEEMVFRLADAADFKSACELMAYMAHRRAGIWWGYRCVLSLLEELRQNPAADRDIASIGTNFKVQVPDWAKVKLPPPPDASSLDALLADARAKNAERTPKAVDPEVFKLVQDAVEVAFGEFKKVHGVHPIDLLKKLGERVKEDSFKVDPNSPVFKAKAELHAKLAAVQKETVETIKSVLPPKVPEHEKKIRDNALQAVFRWVAAPDAENSQKCLAVGNECPDTPSGLLSLSSFWAYGDLMPLGEHPVPTPPGLAANGLNQVFLMCALSKGGTRKVKERYGEYFRLGLEVLTGADNWETAVASG